jgi:hypothetical protein
MKKFTIALLLSFAQLALTAQANEDKVKVTLKTSDLALIIDAQKIELDYSKGKNLREYHQQLIKKLAEYAPQVLDKKRLFEQATAFEVKCVMDAIAYAYASDNVLEHLSEIRKLRDEGSYPVAVELLVRIEKMYFLKYGKEVEGHEVGAIICSPQELESWDKMDAFHTIFRVAQNPDSSIHISRK